MLKHNIKSKISSMSKRKLLFIIGEHLTGKSNGVQEFLKEKYNDEWKEHYIDIGLYLQRSLSESQIQTYTIFPDEFEYDSVQLITELFNERQKDLLVFDHCDWLFAEKQTEWLKKLMQEAEVNRTIIVIVPEEYSELVPSHSYSVINLRGGLS